MAVVIETTLGDITVDLYLDQRPVTCLNFLKLCKMKYYNFNLFHSIRSGFIAQTGDPTGEGSGGQSIFGILEGPEKRFFSGEKMPKIRHANAGLLSMVCTDEVMVGSQFFFTLAPDLDSLDGVHCVIGEVTEGHDVLRKLNDVICDESHRPYRDVRITHTVVLEDPFNDPPGLRAPSRSPSPNPERLKGGRIAPDEEIDETQGKSAAEIQELIEEKEAKARATILEIVGDLPDADIAPPENVLFVCKLNPVTTDEDLEIIFSRFGKIVGCEVIRDKKTGNSLQYAFIEFGDKKSCEDAYFKMDNVLIDDRRIHVDFSQSVSKMRWLGKGKGIQHYGDEKSQDDHILERSKHSRSRDREHNNHKNHHNTKEDKNHKRSENRDKNNDRSAYRDQERHRRNEKNSQIDRNKNESRHRERKRSRSRSKLDSHNRESSKSDSKMDSSKNKHDKNHSKYSDKDSHHRNNSSKGNRESYKSRNDSPVKNSTSHNLTQSDTKKQNVGETKHPRSQKDRSHKSNNENDKRYKDKKETKPVHNHIEPRTPTPPTKENKSKNSCKESKKIVPKNKNRKRRKSESSSSNSDSSSSSSSDSSTCNKNRKKRISSRKRRKYSTSSSSSSDSSSSTSSSSSSDSSSSTSSSSDSEPSKKRKKSNKNRTVKKSRKK